MCKATFAYSVQNFEAMRSCLSSYTPWIVTCDFHLCDLTSATVHTMPDLHADISHMSECSCDASLTRTMISVKVNYGPDVPWQN